MSLVEVLIAATILGSLLAAVGSLFRSNIKQQAQFSNTSSIAQVRANLIAPLKDPTAWLYTTRHNTALLNCIANGATSCPASSSKSPLALYNRIKLLVFDGTSSSNGFTSGGQICSGFVPPPGAGNAACPYGLSLTWAPICTGTCGVWPQIQVVGQFTYNPPPGQGGNFNHLNYDFNIMIQPDGSLVLATYVNNAVIPASPTPVNTLVLMDAGESLTIIPTQTTSALISYTAAVSNTGLSEVCSSAIFVNNGVTQTEYSSITWGGRSNTTTMATFLKGIVMLNAGTTYTISIMHSTSVAGSCTWYSRNLYVLRLQ